MSKTLSDALIGVPSLSPHICMKMVEMVVALKKKSEAEPDCQIKEQLLAYSKAVDSVCFYSAVHQGAALGEFARLIKDRKKRKGGEDE